MPADGANAGVLAQLAAVDLPCRHRLVAAREARFEVQPLFDAAGGRGPERRQIGAVLPEPLEVLQADELGRRAERVLGLEALVERLSRGPEEEDQDDGHLRRDQRPGQPPAPEPDPLLDGQGASSG